MAPNNGNAPPPTNQTGGGGTSPPGGQGSGSATRNGMSSETRLILGMVIAAIVATGTVVAVVVGTVLGSQILHNGTQIRNLATRIDNARDASYADVRKEIQALRSELAARVGPGHVDEMRRDHRRLHDRMHNIEHELSEVDQSLEGLRSDSATTQPLNHRLQTIESKLEQLIQSQQNQNRRTRRH